MNKGIENEKTLQIKIGISLSQMNESHRDKHIFCAIYFVEEMKNLGYTEWIKFNQYVDPSFQKHIEIDYHFDQNFTYQLNVYESKVDHLEKLECVNNKELLGSSTFVLNDVVKNVKSKSKFQMKLSNGEGLATIHAEEHKLDDN